MKKTEIKVGDWIEKKRANYKGQSSPPPIAVAIEEPVQASTHAYSVKVLVYPSGREEEYAICVCQSAAVPSSIDPKFAEKLAQRLSCHPVQASGDRCHITPFAASKNDRPSCFSP